MHKEGNTWPQSLAAYDHLADEDLIFRYRQRGDLGAIYCLFERYAHLAFGCFASKGNDGSRCLEKVEALFMQLIRGDSGMEEQGFRPWLYRQCGVEEPCGPSPAAGISPEVRRKGWERFREGKASFSVLAREWGLNWPQIRPVLRQEARSGKPQWRE